MQILNDVAARIVEACRGAHVEFVFVWQNLAPGATDRLGIGSAELRRRHPRLDTCDIRGYGDDGRLFGLRPATCWCRRRAGGCRSAARRARAWSRSAASE